MSMATSLAISFRHTFGFGQVPRIHAENLSVPHVCKTTGPRGQIWGCGTKLSRREPK